MPRVAIERARALTRAALANAGVDADNARDVADALIRAERDGLASHGLARVAAYADQAAAGKVDGRAKPVVVRDAGASVVIDARHGFAFPAIAAGRGPAMRAARRHGIALLAIRHSHHAGVLGAHVEWFAEAGLVAFGFANAPAAIAPWGGRRAVFGTNPIAFAAPREAAAPVVIDLSVSGVARGKVMLARQRGEAIPPGWALDADGRPTTDAEAAMAGTMLPLGGETGGAKGAALALIVEIMAAVLTGASRSTEASSLFDDVGDPPDLGQSFLVIDPDAVAPGFGSRLDALLATMLTEPGVRLPGARRLESRLAIDRDGITISDALYADLTRRAGQSA